MLSHIKQIPNAGDAYKDALELLTVDIDSNLNNDKLKRRATKIEKKVLQYWDNNNYEIRKSYMVMSYLASSLHEQNAVDLGENTKTVLFDMNTIITEAYKDKNIAKQDASTAKQVPKVAQILQDEGLF